MRNWLVIGAVPLALVPALVGQTPSRRPKPRPLRVVIAEAPSWWIPSPAPNSGAQSAEGPLYFRAVLENPNAFPVSVDVSFQSYLADGTRYEGCYEPGGGGGGVTTEIPSHGRALVFCNRATVRRTVQGLQVTMRVWSVVPVTSASRLADVIEDGPIEGEQFLYGVNWDAYARVKSQSSRDIDVGLLFRFLTADSMQVATCESGDLHIEPEVVLRATCSVPITLPNGSPQPVTVQAEVRPPI